MPSGPRRQFTVLAVASGGGHWEELMLLKSVLAPQDPIYATTNVELASREDLKAVELPDSNRDVPLRALLCFWACLRLILRVRPNLVITTGALPGLFCVMVGRFTGASTIWIDSVANSDKPSLSGRFARPFASIWLTQWRHLSDLKGVRFEGALL